MKGNHVSLREELLQRGEAEAVFGPVRRGGSRPAEQIHPDARPESCHVRSDGPEPHDAERFPLEINASELGRQPFAALEAVVGRGDAACQGEHESQGIFPDRCGTAPRCVGRGHAVLGACGEVSAVAISDAERTDEIELGTGLDHLRVHDRVVEKDGIDALETVDEVRFVLGRRLRVVDVPTFFPNARSSGFWTQPPPSGKTICITRLLAIAKGRTMRGLWSYLSAILFVSPVSATKAGRPLQRRPS